MHMVWDNRDPNGMDAVFTGSPAWGHLPHGEPVGQWSRPLSHSFLFSPREDAVLQLRAHSVIGGDRPLTCMTLVPLLSHFALLNTRLRFLTFLFFSLGCSLYRLPIPAPWKQLMGSLWTWMRWKDVFTFINLWNKAFPPTINIGGRL